MKYIKFLKSTYGKDEGDIVKIENEDNENYYYEDGYDMYCYIEKDSKDIKAIDPVSPCLMCKNILDKEYSEECDDYCDYALITKWYYGDFYEC